MKITTKDKVQENTAMNMVEYCVELERKKNSIEFDAKVKCNIQYKNNTRLTKLWLIEAYRRHEIQSYASVKRIQ